MWKSIFLVIIQVFLLFKSSSANCKGCTELDELTFDKVVKKFKSVLVKFDVAFPYGPAHEEFEKFASEIGNVSISGTTEDLLIGAVGIKDYGEKENEKLGLRYGVKHDGVFPVIKLFLNGDLEKPVEYSQKDKVTSLNMYKFLKQHSNVYVRIPGCVKEFDQIVDKFMKNKDKRSDLFNEAEKLQAGMKDEKKQKSGKIYVMLMKRVIEKGDEFIKQEEVRIEKLMTEKITDQKKKDLNDRLNILSSFKLDTAGKKDEL